MKSKSVEISQKDAKDLIKLCDYFLHIDPYEDEIHLMEYSKRLAPELRTKVNLNQILSTEEN